MVVRLLLAVLTVAGPVPAGACTCAAARGPTHPPARAVVAAAAAPAKSCGCQRHAAEEVTPAADADPHQAAGCAEPPPRHGHHDRDCPAASPRPTSPTGVTTPAADLSADSCPARPAALGVPADGRPNPPPRPAAAGPTLPLFLSHCSLRI